MLNTNAKIVETHSIEPGLLQILAKNPRDSDIFMLWILKYMYNVHCICIVQSWTTSRSHTNGCDKNHVYECVLVILPVTNEYQANNISQPPCRQCNRLQTTNHVTTFNDPFENVSLCDQSSMRRKKPFNSSVVPHNVLGMRISAFLRLISCHCILKP